MQPRGRAYEIAWTQGRLCGREYVVACWKKEEKNVQFLIPKIPKLPKLPQLPQLPQLRGLRGRSREKKKVFSA
jgi:hypothetical protein